MIAERVHKFYNMDIIDAWFKKKIPYFSLTLDLSHTKAVKDKNNTHTHKQVLQKEKEKQYEPKKLFFFFYGS